MVMLGWGGGVLARFVTWTVKILPIHFFFLKIKVSLSALKLFKIEWYSEILENYTMERSSFHRTRHSSGFVGGDMIASKRPCIEKVK